jgi:GTP-binding protein
MFIDRVTIDVQAGNGGDGCSSFRRERFVPRGGPDGGDGGNGGSVIIMAEAGVDSLMAVAHRKLWKADHGQHGQGSNRHGRNGADLVIKVPPGTIVMDTQEQLVIKDLARPGDRVFAARGGKGGKGNAHFKSATNRAPRESSPGDAGERRRLTLELKVIADVGLIGKPNAGKSTLLSRLSHARPEIADYPFTTKHPNLGRVQIDMERSFVLADIPGLIEGAHQGVGLGHDFLRHIQRTGVLVHLVEPAPLDGTDPVANYRCVREEVVQFDPSLGSRPEIVVVSKCELPGADEAGKALARELPDPPILISAVTGQGLNLLTAAIVRELDRRGAT